MSESESEPTDSEPETEPETEPEFAPCISHRCDFNTKLPNWIEEASAPTPLTLECLSLRSIISEGSDGITSADVAPPIMAALNTYRKSQHPEGWVVVGVESFVERLDGKPITSEEEYTRGTDRIDMPEMGEKIYVKEFPRKLRVKVHGHRSLDWTLRWEDWVHYDGFYGPTIYGEDKIEDATITSEQITRFRSYCTIPRCMKFNEKFVPGSKQTLTVKANSLIWFWTDVIEWAPEAKFANPRLHDLRISWKSRARKVLKTQLSV